MEERLKYLFRQYLNNTCTRKEFDEFFTYIRDAAHNEKIRELIKKVYDESGSVHADTYVDESGNLVLPKPEWHESPAPAPQRRHKKTIGVVAAFVVLVVAGTLFWQWRVAGKPSIRVIMAKRITHRSEYKYLLLPDSTQVWLNTASTLEYPQAFTGSIREVYLTGEAYFDVKHADKLPFIIHTGKVSTKVLGTAFNVKAYPGRENIIVSVSRGKVRVEYENKQVALLTQGQQVKVKNTSHQATEKKIVSSEAAAWQQGNLVYDDETMEDIVAELQEVYDVRIKVLNEVVRQERIATSFRREIGIDQALSILCNLTETKLKSENGVYFIE